MMRVPTGTELLDQLLQGGYETDSITTIYGPAGAGKTNLALLAAIETAKKGKKVIFIDTEGGFSITRLQQLLPDYKKLLDNIVFLRPMTFQEQHQAIEQLRELINDRIGLIIVDTINMLYRLQRSFKDEDNNFNHDLSLQMLALNELSRRHNIPVLLLSQVYQSFEGNGVKIVGGDILLYTSKCLLELQIHGDKRKAIVRKHRSLPSDQERLFKIKEKGIEEITPQ